MLKLERSNRYTVDGMMEARPEISPSFACDSLPLDAGDKVLFYSESLLRLRGNDGEAYGSDQLQNVLHQYAQCSAHDMLDHLWHDLFQFLGGGTPESDLVAAVIERRPENMGSFNPLMSPGYPWKSEWVYERA